MKVIVVAVANRELYRNPALLFEPADHFRKIARDTAKGLVLKGLIIVEDLHAQLRKEG